MDLEKTEARRDLAVHIYSPLSGKKIRQNEKKEIRISPKADSEKIPYRLGWGRERGGRKEVRKGSCPSIHPPIHTDEFSVHSAAVTHQHRVGKNKLKPKLRGEEVGGNEWRKE